ncbi:hypothetical protein [Niastella populi]|nr:hypothetical protein [Niastella populi]
MKEGNQMVHRYVKTYEALADVSELTKDSIIYEGEEHWRPEIAGQCERYKQFTDPQLRAGLKAQYVFKRQAEDRGLVVQEINQDKESYKKAYKIAKCAIKRGDFIIRNAGGIEVDVKCKAFKREQGERYFHFNVEDFPKHGNMTTKITNVPVIIAVYERQGEKVNENQLFMFEIQEMQKQLETLTKIDSEHGPCYLIPIGKTKKGFQLIEQYKRRIPA